MAVLYWIGYHYTELLTIRFPVSHLQRNPALVDSSHHDDNRHLALRVVLMPRDTNSHGSIFGGVILSHIDLAGAVGANHAIRELGSNTKPLVTVGMNSVEFHQPVFVGDLLSFWTHVVRIGRTSITVHVQVQTERTGGDWNVTEADVTYVAVKLDGKDRQPIPIRDE